MLVANIKKPSIEPLVILEQMLIEGLPPIHPSWTNLDFTFYNFVETVVGMLSDYARSSFEWTFNLFLVDQYLRKEATPGEIYRQAIGLIRCWGKFAEYHEDAKLLLSLLGEGRNTKQAIKWFLKVRKNILKTLTPKILQQVSITHSDALAISHILFDVPHRTAIAKKLNNLFINLKRKMINTAKIDGAVACEFFINAKEDLSIRSYPKEVLAKLNHNVSFSEEFAECYQKNPENHQLISALQQEWEKECSEKPMGLNAAINSLKQLSEKDQEIDAKLEGTGVLKHNKQYEGWEKFLKANNELKSKLMKNKV